MRDVIGIPFCDLDDITLQALEALRSPDVCY